MKNLKFTLAAMMISLFTVIGANKVQAQITTGEQILAAAGNLVNVQIGSVNVEVVDLIDVSDVDVDVDALNNILVSIIIDDSLNDLFREADLISRNQIVVGVLSDQNTFLVMDRKHNPKKK